MVGAAVGELNAIATVAYTGRTGCIEVKKGAGIKTLDQLKGKKIGTRPGSTIDSVLRSKVLPVHHLKDSDFQMVNVDFKDQVAALAGGSIDAFAGVEPFCALAESLELFRVAAQLREIRFDAEHAGLDRLVREEQSASPQSRGRGHGGSLRDIPQRSRQGEGHPAKLYTKAGYNMDPDTLGKLIARLDVNAKYIPGLDKYFTAEADDLAKAGRLRGGNTVDWSKVLIADFLPN